MSVKSAAPLVIRRATPQDGAACGQICYDAFSTISAAHCFPCDLPAPEAAVGLLTMMFSSDGFYCVVAEREGRIVGSNCVDERSIIAGLGPITVDPSVQNSGAGRKLMQAVMDRAHSRNAAGVRLVQAAFPQSLVVFVFESRLRYPASHSPVCRDELMSAACPDASSGPLKVATWRRATRYPFGYTDSPAAPTWRNLSSKKPPS